MHTCGIYKNLVQMVQMSLLTGKKWRCRNREWTCGHCMGRRGGMNSESSSDIDTLPRVK